MRKRPSKPDPLDYSSPAQERARDDAREAERRRKLGDYNEATFGEREPYKFWPILVGLAVASVGFIATLDWLRPPRWQRNLIGTVWTVVGFGTVYVLYNRNRFAAVFRAWWDRRAR